MGLFGLFAGKAERKKREYEKRLSDVEARLKDVQEYLARAKGDVEEFTQSIKEKLTEYDSATGAPKQLIGEEIKFLNDRKAEAEQRFATLMTAARQLGLLRDKILELLAVLVSGGAATMPDRELRRELEELSAKSAEQA